jgi:hypothetical protein
MDAADAYCVADAAGHQAGERRAVSDRAGDPRSAVSVQAASVRVDDPHSAVSVLVVSVRAGDLRWAASDQTGVWRWAIGPL